MLLYKTHRPIPIQTSLYEMVLSHCSKYWLCLQKLIQSRQSLLLHQITTYYLNVGKTMHKVCKHMEWSFSRPYFWVLGIYSRSASKGKSTFRLFPFIVRGKWTKPSDLCARFMMLVCASDRKMVHFSIWPYFSHSVSPSPFPSSYMKLADFFNNECSKIPSCNFVTFCFRLLEDTSCMTMICLGEILGSMLDTIIEEAI